MSWKSSWKDVQPGKSSLSEKPSPSRVSLNAFLEHGKHEFLESDKDRARGRIAGPLFLIEKASLEKREEIRVSIQNACADKPNTPERAQECLDVCAAITGNETLSQLFLKKYAGKSKDFSMIAKIATALPPDSPTV